MRLGTLRDGSRDGSLVVVDRSGQNYASARSIVATLQAALDGWDVYEAALRELALDLEHQRIPGQPLDPARLAAPLPRAYEWVDGSAYLNHILLVRKARGAEPPPGLERDPLVYQGGSGVLLGPRDPLPLPDPAWGLDFEAEIGVVLSDVPRGISASEARASVRLFVLLNDVTYRNLVPPELAKGFGFFVSKPATAFAPFAVTADELGEAYYDGRAHLRVHVSYNGALVGELDSGPEMHFSFCDLIAHIAQTRAFTAGTLLGSGTVSNRDPSRGVSCLAERRTLETLARGAPETPFMNLGDQIRIEAFDASGFSVFGAIEQQVVPA
jgi:fumarylacetoacetate (FAA) hydrolase